MNGVKYIALLSIDAEDISEGLTYQASDAQTI